MRPLHAGPQSLSWLQLGGVAPAHRHLPPPQPQPQGQSALTAHVVVATGTHFVASALQVSRWQLSVVNQWCAQPLAGPSQVCKKPPAQRVTPSVGQPPWQTVDVQRPSASSAKPGLHTHVPSGWQTPAMAVALSLPWQLSTKCGSHQLMSTHLPDVSSKPIPGLHVQVPSALQCPASPTPCGSQLQVLSLPGVQPKPGVASALLASDALSTAVSVALSATASGPASVSAAASVVAVSSGAQQTATAGASAAQALSDKRSATQQNFMASPQLKRLTHRSPCGLRRRLSNGAAASAHPHAQIAGARAGPCHPRPSAAKPLPRLRRHAMTDQPRDTEILPPRYDFTTIEARWQAYWLAHKTFRTSTDPTRKKAFVLDMFPYPSGAGLHVGHPEGYTATDIYSRFLRMNGYNVLHPMGWDAFGLPAEQYAIQTGTHPAQTTQVNIKTFRRQIQSLGFSYDWDREVDTTDPTYYKWTQWIFLQLFKKGLAYQAEIPVNWCAALGTVLSNEEVIDGKSERGNHPVVRVPMRQWMLKITAYGDDLLQSVETLDWPEGIKAMQRNWIGRSEGAEVDFNVEGGAGTLRVFTTRPDTLFGATYMVLAPEHALVDRLTTPSQKGAVDAYVEAARHKSERDRQAEVKEKSGVFTGAYAVNPLTGTHIPIWIADYVLGGYGTGAIMAVPAHDERDFAFAQQFGLPVVQVVSKDGALWTEAPTQAFIEHGVAVNSKQFDGLPTVAVKKAVTDWLVETGIGERKVNFKLRDWVFSRQRYWGEPIPIYYPVIAATDGGALREAGLQPRDVADLVEQGSWRIDYATSHAVPESALPLTLPPTDDFLPTGNAEPPLAKCHAWRFFQQDGKWYARETNTMPQWAGSCWYYLRYIDPHNPDALASPEALRYWLPVDLYVGGAEHAVLHLLYARFWHKVLFDLGVVPTAEPFQRLINQGMILGEDGEKMSKSRGNVINPDDVLREHGADTFRLYEMFMGPLEQVKPWSTRDIVGSKRFLQRVWNLFEKPVTDEAPDPAILRVQHRLVKKVTEDSHTLRFNTAISAMMIALNELAALPALPRATADAFVRVLAPYAPHLAEELWEKLGHAPSVGLAQWPTFDEALCADDSVEIPVQVSGKMRGKLQVKKDTPAEELARLALADPAVQKWTEGKEILKVIPVVGRMVSVVVKG